MCFGPTDLSISYGLTKHLSSLHCVYNPDPQICMHWQNLIILTVPKIDNIFAFLRRIIVLCWTSYVHISNKWEERCFIDANCNIFPGIERVLI